MKPTYAVACCVLIIFSWGCAGLKETKHQPPLPLQIPGADPATIIENLTRINRELISFKGLGKIKIWRSHGHQSTRIAWAGSHSQKLRVEILGVTGRPLSALAFDGSRFYLSLHTEKRFYQKQTRHASLERLISIPISISDTIAIMAGRLPLWEDSSGSLTVNPSHPDTYLLTIRKGWFRKQTAKIYLREDMHTVYQFELYGSRNQLQYRVTYLKQGQYDQFRLPALLQISDDQHNRVQISAERIWPNAEMAAETFILKPPR